MLAASGMSLPEMLVLGRILQPRVALLFLGATPLMYLLLGFGFTLLRDPLTLPCRLPVTKNLQQCLRHGSILYLLRDAASGAHR